MSVSGLHGVGSLLADAAFRRVWLVGVGSGGSIWLEMLVVGIFAFDTTGSPLLVALLVILRLAPLALFGSVVGTFADRLPPRLLLCTTLTTAALLSAAVFLLFAFGLGAYWVVAAAAFSSGMVWCTDMPLRRRILGDIAGLERIGPAMSLDSATSNCTRMLAPLVGGVLYEALGTSGAFALSACLYAGCVALLLRVPAGTSPGTPDGRRGSILRDYREALSLAARDRDILRILLLTVLFNLWGFPFVSMIPVIGREDLVLSAGWIGVLAALEGGGAFLGSLIIAVRARPTAFRRLYYFSILFYLLLVMLAGAMGDAVPMAVVLFFVGLAGAGFSAMQATLIYSVAPPHMRGRMFGLLVLCIGTGLVGFTNAGLMGEWFGGSTAIQIIAAEGLLPLLLIGIGWRQLRYGTAERSATSAGQAGAAPVARLPDRER
jgi:MFS family permease